MKLVCAVCLAELVPSGAAFACPGGAPECVSVVVDTDKLMTELGAAAAARLPQYDLAQLGPTEFSDVLDVLVAETSVRPDGELVVAWKI